MTFKLFLINSGTVEELLNIFDLKRKYTFRIAHVIDKPKEKCQEFKIGSHRIEYCNSLSQHSLGSEIHCELCVCIED